MTAPAKQNDPGIIPDEGGAWLLSCIVEPSRGGTVPVGDTLDAATALYWYLFNHVVPHDELMARDLASRIARNPAHTVRLTKQLLRESQRVTLGSVLEMSAVLQAISRKTRDHVEVVDAFLKEREPRFEG